LAATSQEAARLPPPAGPGDRVGVAALSGPVDPQRLEQGLAALRGLGFVPVLADNAVSRAGLFAGGDAQRLAAFHRLAADADLPAIFFTRGGHGLLRLLPGIDWELLRRRPRVYLGYSDLTPLLLAIVRRLGLVAFHGPLVAGELARGLTAAERESLLGALAGRYPVEVPLGGWLREGAAAGPLLGGCLSLLTATLGTAWFPELRGALLFVEDVNEPAYRLDRMLTHLALSGNLESIGGMIFGHLDASAASESPAGEASRAPSMELQRPSPPLPSLHALLADNLRGFGWPLAWGLDAGHRSPNLTLPLGLPARLGAGRGRSGGARLTIALPLAPRRPRASAPARGPRKGR
jgi:muramoyltetrapeptide carboxypeptidase